MPLNFAVIGVAGYIAPRHLRAIRDTGNRLIAAVDPNDSVGLLDQYSFDVRYFTEIERFDRHLEKLRRGSDTDRVHYVSICSPNYLHDAHCRLALRVHANAICEKPLVINPWNLDALQDIETEYDGKINTVLQLRLHPSLVELRDKLSLSPTDKKHQVILTYVTARGAWYHTSWKGYPNKSGGIATNIGIHLFDLLLWLFGEVGSVGVYYSDSERMSGFLDLERAQVLWYLSINSNDLPFPVTPGSKSTYRSISIDGEEVEFTEGFTDLHTRVYQETLAGRGFGIDEARPSIELVHRIRAATISTTTDEIHPFVKGKL
ncbi:MAG: Gfo/Idh/MocA family oxidoreductase [Anaerolineae bacterium]|nr:Gfo/Idh/MocA family oxidoreductase [Anaerolineae bacterium]